MGNREIKVDAFTVSRHSQAMSQKNSNLQTKASKSNVDGGKTNFSGYTKGISCNVELKGAVAALVSDINKDCNNIRYAAAELNGLDVEISKKLDGMNLNIMK